MQSLNVYVVQSFQIKIKCILKHLESSDSSTDFPDVKPLSNGIKGKIGTF